VVVVVPGGFPDRFDFMLHQRLEGDGFDRCSSKSPEPFDVWTRSAFWTLQSVQAVELKGWPAARRCIFGVSQTPRKPGPAPQPASWLGVLEPRLEHFFVGRSDDVLFIEGLPVMVPAEPLLPRARERMVSDPFCNGNLDYVRRLQGVIAAGVRVFLDRVLDSKAGFEFIAWSFESGKRRRLAFDVNGVP
jgi:hypothetical protein